MSKPSKEDLLRMHTETRERVQRVRAVMQAGGEPAERAGDGSRRGAPPASAPLVVRLRHDFHLQLTELLVTEPEQLDFLIRPEQQLPGMGKFIRNAGTANASAHAER